MKRKSRWGSFLGGQTWLGPNPRSQFLFFLHSFLQPFIKVRINSLLLWNTVFGHVTNCLRAIVIAIPPDVPMHAHFHFLIPCRFIVGEQICKGVLPCFSFRYFEFVRFAMIFFQVACCFVLAFLVAFLTFSFICFIVFVHHQ
jgi:hypothetical protein